MAKISTDKKKSLSGVVLIMVVTVMFVLIIMLLATLSVVSTAQNRYYTKYEENQAYYTARSALDVFTNNLLSDKDYYAYDGSTPRVYIHDNNVTTDKMKQGLALQLNLYTITAQSGDNIEQSDLLSYANSLNPRKDEYKNYYGTDNTKVQTDSVTGNEYIEYRVTVFPQVSSATDNYGKMVDTVKNGATDQIEATIRVEVLDRNYDIDESKVNDGTYADRTALLASSDGPAAFVNGARGKDWMRLKVTATVTFMGVESTAVLIYDTNQKDPPASDNALTTTGSFSGGSGAQVRTAGGVASMDIGTSGVGDGNNMSGTIFSLGSLKWISSSETVLNANETIVGMGGIASSSNPTKVKATGDGAYVFLGGTSTLNTGGNFGDSAHNINVIADNIVKISASDLYFYGDVYTTTFESQSPNPGKIHTINGKTYVKNLILPDDQIDRSNGATIGIKLDHFSDANLQLCSGFTISNQSGTYTATSADLASCVFTKNGVIVNSTDIVTTTDAFDINSYTAVKDSDGRVFRQYKLPFAVNGNTTIEVPTAQAYFRDYFKEDAFHDSTGDLKNFSDPTNDNPADPVNDYNTIYSQANKNSWLYSGADLLADYMELPDLNPGDPARTISSMIVGGEITDGSGVKHTVNSMPTGNYTFDLSSGDQYYLLDQSYYSGCNWTVTGDNGRLILIIPEGTNTHLLDAFGSIDWSAVSATTTFDNCVITTDDITTTTTAVTNGTTKAPHVDIYGGTGCFLNTGNQNLISGYIMMPTGFMNLNNGGKVGTIAYDNGEGTVVNISNTAIIGSLLCQEFCESNQSGIIYLDKSSGDNGQAGDPIHDFKSYQYARN